MKLDSGSINFRLFYLPAEINDSIVKNFEKRLAPPLESLGVDPLTGWVGGRFPLDRDLSEETAVIGPYVTVQTLKMERKIPKKLLSSVCKQEELKLMALRQVNFLSNSDRKEIRENTAKQLKPNMPPAIENISCVVDLRNKLLVSDAMSDKQILALTVAYREATGHAPKVLDPASAALKRKHLNATDLKPARFSPDQEVSTPSEQSLGSEFLTWLWWAWEKGDNIWKLPDDRSFGIELEGPIYLHRHDTGARRVSLHDGEVLMSAEAETALRLGKTVTKIKLTVAFGDLTIKCSIDDSFSFRSVALPKSKQREYNALVEERMAAIELLHTAFFTIYDEFLEQRFSDQTWRRISKEISKWIETMPERRGEKLKEKAP